MPAYTIRTFEGHLVWGMGIGAAVAIGARLYFGKFVFV